MDNSNQQRRPDRDTRIKFRNNKECENMSTDIFTGHNTQN
jgi:hypothetical protein